MSKFNVEESVGRLSEEFEQFIAIGFCPSKEDSNMLLAVKSKAGADGVIATLGVLIRETAEKIGVDEVKILKRLMVAMSLNDDPALDKAVDKVIKALKND